MEGSEKLGNEEVYKEVKKIMRFNQKVFSITIEVKFKKADGTILKVPAERGEVFYSQKDVRKIIRLLKEQGK